MHTWIDICRQRKLPYKRGQLSIYAKQMIGLVELRLNHPSSSALDFKVFAQDFFRKTRQTVSVEQ